MSEIRRTHCGTYLQVGSCPCEVTELLWVEPACRTQTEREGANIDSGINVRHLTKIKAGSCSATLAGAPLRRCARGNFLGLAMDDDSA